MGSHPLFWSILSIIGGTLVLNMLQMQGFVYSLTKVDISEKRKTFLFTISLTDVTVCDDNGVYAIVSTALQSNLCCGQLI